MSRCSRFSCLIVLSLTLNCSDITSAQHFPNKPVRVVTAETGGGPDFVARLIAQNLTVSLGQQVIVENRGGSGIIPAQLVAQALPDGYTLLLYSSALWLLPFMRDNVPYDAVRDFSPVTLAVSSPNILVIHPSIAANSVKDWIALAKSRPGELNYSSGVSGSSAHLAAELFKSMAGVNLVRIPYKGSAPALTALLANEVQTMFAIASGVPPHIKSGRLRALAVTSAQPSALFPGMPTIAASGLPGYDSVLVLGIYAPARTSSALIRRLNQEIVGVLRRADVSEKFLSAGVETVASSPEQLVAAVKSDMAMWGKIIRDAGIRAE